MAEYIEKEAIIRQLCLTTGCSYYGEDVRTIIEFPAADVQLVKHGDWKINSDGYYPYCSECGKEPESGKMTKFCPNCGTRMDGDTE